VLSPNTVTSSAAKMTVVKVLAVKFSTIETGCAYRFQSACLAFIFPAPCALHLLPLNTHKQSFYDIAEVAENAVTPHIGTLLKYA
jgi:hypothetical protein